MSIALSLIFLLVLVLMQIYNTKDDMFTIMMKSFMFYILFFFFVLISAVLYPLLLG